MNVLALASLPAAGLLLGIAGWAGMHRGLPLGRKVLFLAALCGAVDLGLLAWVQAQQVSGDPEIFQRIGWGATLAAAAFWALFALRFGTAGAPRGFDAVLHAGVPAAAAAVYLWGMRDGGPLWAVTDTGVWSAALGTGAARAGTGFVLLTGALGVVRFHSLREIARRDGREALRRAAVGPLIASLGLFLFASQALLYGGFSFRIFSFASLGLIPACVLMIPVFREPASSACALPEGMRPPQSPLILMGLGVFLIGLAVLGQAIHSFLPGRELIWFHWGGVILLFFLASLWLVPGLRDGLRRRFEPPIGPHGDTRWEWARVNQALVPVDSPALLAARLAALLDDLLGRTGSALWLAEPGGGRMRPVSAHSGPLPWLERDNPIRAALRRSTGVLDLSRPPGKLDEMPAFVENLELVDRMGFRVFVPLRFGEDELGVLGLSPRADHRFEPEVLGLLENVGAQVSNVIWGMMLAERLARAREGESFHRVGSFVLHDLKNAVGVLKGILANAGAHLDDPRFRTDLVGSLQATTARMENILKRLGSGVTGPPVPARVEAGAVFRNLLRDLAPAAEEAGVRLEVRTQTPIVITTDPGRIETILHNLVKNAIEATPANGTVTVSARTRVGEQTSDGGRGGVEGRGESARLEIRVADQGAEADLDRIQRALLSPVPSHKPEGWGIGLYQSALLAESLGGTVRAEEGPEGTTLVLRLPLTLAERTEEPGTVHNVESEAGHTRR